jgi:peptidoglycan glycosyltransferase
MLGGRRNTELGLMLLGALITSGAYTLASLGRTASLPTNLIPFLLVVFVLLGTAHVATRRLAPDAEATLLPLAALLNGIGYVFIARLDHHLAGLQAVWTGLGVAAYIGVLVFVRRARDLERFRYLFAVGGIGLLLLPLAPVLGQNINGARLWVRVGTVSFQPVELAKIALTIFFVSYLAEKREVLAVATRRLGFVRMPAARYFGPVVLAWALSLVIMTAERDIGFSLLFFVLFAAVLWVATGRMSYLVAGGALFAAGAAVAWRLFANVHDRVHVWLNPWAAAGGKGYQSVQAMFSMAAGGLAGTGLALGSPQRIPVVASDFIFAAIGEELGLFGTTAVVVAFLLIVGAGLRVALRTERPFDKLLAAALASIVGFQAFVIMAGVTRLLPLTGITLPFVSYGGSSLIANYILIALLMRISDEAARPPAGHPPQPLSSG